MIFPTSIGESDKAPSVLISRITTPLIPVVNFRLITSLLVTSRTLIHKAFNKSVERLWVHTCSLDHKHALNNYLSKGFKIFKEETINFSL